ncbi:MAG: multidrug ABC transporter ATP-binding protein [Acidobacteria bacterium]|nr:MAG: multidrug ABC transporter ATP-binding protein [Acidobacteriota bacterium]
MADAEDRRRRGPAGAADGAHGGRRSRRQPVDRVRRRLHVRVRSRRRQGARRAVPRRRRPLADEPLLRRERSRPRDAGAVRVRKGSTGGRACRAAACPAALVIAARHLTRRFGPRTAVDDVTFEVGRSEIVALLGPNGAGKTTTLRMLAGLIAPTSGSVAIGGVQLTRANGAALRMQIGFLTEAPGLWDRLTVRENLRVYAGLYGLADADARIDRVLDLFAIADRANARTVELSKGTRQKAALARTLLHDPTILLLDEPTSGLDPEVTRSVRMLLDERRAAGCSILVSTHNLDEAERLADRVAVLDERLVAIDDPAALRARLTTGRTIVRVAGDPSAYLPAIRSIVGPGVDVAVERSSLALQLPHPELQTPAIVAALVAAGAQILEVRAEMPALEDVYVHLMGADGGGA